MQFHILLLVCYLIIDRKYAKYKFKNLQGIKRAVGEQIVKELIFDSFVSSFESTKIYSIIKEVVQSFLDKDQMA